MRTASEDAIKQIVAEVTGIPVELLRNNTFIPKKHLQEIGQRLLEYTSRSLLIFDCQKLTVGTLITGILMKNTR